MLPQKLMCYVWPQLTELELLDGSENFRRFLEVGHREIVFDGHIRTPSSLSSFPLLFLSSFDYKPLLSLLSTKERQKTDVQIPFKVQTIPDPSPESISSHSAPESMTNWE